MDYWITVAEIRYRYRQASFRATGYLSSIHPKLMKIHTQKKNHDAMGGGAQRRSGMRKKKKKKKRGCRKSAQKKQGKKNRGWHSRTPSEQ
jgi:hypothetical protein